MSMKDLWSKQIKVNRCETIEQAKKQAKDRSGILLIGIAFAICSSILAGLLSDIWVYNQLLLYMLAIYKLISGLFMIVSIVVCVTGIIILIYALLEVNRFKVVLCQKCGKKYKLENAEYELLQDRESSQSPDNNGYTEYTVVSEYEFNCTCEICGDKNTFRFGFEKIRGTKDKFGNVINETSFDVEDKITKFFS